ncbi:MAG: Foldase protein PrsA precursor [Labilithrix sp.]|nr:Foldase protein PrsA precursor [Labilithrix sp.]
MKRLPSGRTALVTALALGAVLVARPLRADDPEAARRARVVLTVGGARVTVGELEDRIAAIPLYQVSQFGGTREAVARAYVEQVLVRDLLLGEGAHVRGLDKEPPTKQLVERALSGVTLRNQRAALTAAAVIPMTEVQAYYDANRARFDSPDRVNLWRILCKTRDEAATVLETAKHDGSMARFNDLAREHSIDKATNLRGGNLGFVAPDGTSNEAGVKVDPGLVKAAQAVKDGELVPQPVAEGEGFAVVWRRATVPANRRSVEESAAQIRNSLFRERSEQAEKKLIADLRAANVKDVNESLLGIVELRPFDAGVAVTRSPATPLAKPSSSSR